MIMDYKHTLNLPQTKFPMKAQLPQREPLILGEWQKKDIYSLIQKRARKATKYILHDGPPYANGDIHIGHVLNKTLKDIVVKYKNMRGFDSAYVPGWDCHGLPVEHALFKELGIDKYQITQVDFRKKAHDYAMKFVNIQRAQFERLGIFGDWKNPYLTLSPQYEEAIIRSFAELVKKDYVYRDLKPVNWCFECETALAEAEVEYEERSSPSIFVKFKIIDFPKKLAGRVDKDKRFYAIVWTTTPWTLIANVAIALRADFRYAALEVKDEIWLIQEDLAASLLEKLGVHNYKKIAVMLGEELEGLAYEDIFQPARRSDFKFVLADYVSKEEGTGLVHTAPGHGQEDYRTGKKYNLEMVMPVDKKGRFYQDIAMEFKGSHVFKANPAIIERLKRQGNLLSAQEVTHTYPHCWRCKKAIIFRSTRQWFLDIDKHNLRKKMIRSVNQDIQWVPASGQERISAMIELRPDWCLSRQRYWGVPIPSLVCSQCNNEFLDSKVIDNFADFVSQEGSDAWFVRQMKDFLKKDLRCPYCDYRGKDFGKGEDILDVWFDSGVSHQAVLKKRKELSFPCGLYLEGSDQHRGWFQSSLICSMAIDQRPPFKTVLTHGFVVDGKGEKMSKSRGNVVSPHDVIKDYGAEILRIWVASSGYNEDIRISTQIIARITEAYRKIRNTVRFILSNLYDFNPQVDKVGYEELRKIDKWILFRAEGLLTRVTQAYEGFQFQKAYREIYNFCNQDLSMYYLDMVKGRLYISAAHSRQRRAAQTSIYETLNILIRLMAPIFVFSAEEIWEHMPKDKGLQDCPSVHLLDWPCPHEVFGQKDLVARAKDIESELKEVIGLIPTVTKILEEKRSQGLIGSSFDAKIILLTNEESSLLYLTRIIPELREIFKVSAVEIKKETGDKIRVVVEKAEGNKCQRCWNYSRGVGQDSRHPSLCESCLDVIGGNNEEKDQQKGSAIL